MAGRDRQPRRTRFPKACEVIRQGDIGDRAWLIEDGQMEVVMDGPQGPRQLAVIGRGSIVGEMALIDQGVRSANVRTLTEASCLELDRDTFRQLIDKCEPLATYLLETLVATIRRAYGLPQEERSEGGAKFRSSHAFDRILDRRVFGSGYTFFHQDDPATAAYLIQTGRVSIQRVGEAGLEELAQLGPGRIFGELALINEAPRRASAVAIERTVCEIIHKHQFDDAIATMPPILRALTKIYIGQLAPPKK